MCLRNGSRSEVTSSRKEEAREVEAPHSPRANHRQTYLVATGIDPRPMPSSSVQFSVLSWNARALDATLAPNEAREKLAVLRGVILELRPKVVAILEVIAAGASLAERLSSFSVFHSSLPPLGYPQK